MGNVNKAVNTAQPISNYRTLPSVALPTNEFDYEALLIGTSLYRRISTVRRFFCLFALFDFLFTFLVWIIYLRTQFSTLSYSEAFSLEILKYRIESSLFDLVSLACFRFLIILFCYCLFISSHWWAVALSTWLTIILAILKVFLFEWSTVAPLIPVAILIFSFILSWGEAWFFYIKVVPSENKAAFLLAKYINQQIPRVPTSLTMFSSEEDEFMSVAGSEDEDEFIENESSEIVEHCHVVVPQQLQEFKCDVDQAIEAGLDLLLSDNWKMSKIQKQLIVQKMKLPSKETLFKFVGVLNHSPNLVRDCLFNRVDILSKWNPSIKQALVVETINPHTDIIHFEAKLSFATASRDFVCARSRQKRENTYIQGTKSVLYSEIVPSKGTIRGNLEHSLFIITPIDDDPRKCHLQWLLSADLKGWISEYVSSIELEEAMINTILNLQDYCKVIQNTS